MNQLIHRLGTNHKVGMYTLNEDTDMKAKFGVMARRLEELEVKKIREVQAIFETPVQVMSCSICQSFEHLVEECPIIPTVREMFGDCNTYNSNWRDHPNFSWRPQPPQYQQLSKPRTLNKLWWILARSWETLLETRNPSMLKSNKKLKV